MACAALQTRVHRHFHVGTTAIAQTCEWLQLIALKAQEPQTTSSGYAVIL